MNKKEIAAAAKAAYEAELAKKSAANPETLKTLKADWETKQAEADAEDTKVITTEELSGIIRKEVRDAIDGSDLSEVAKKAVTPEAIQTAAAKAIADYQGKVITLDQAATVSAAAMKSVLTGTKMPSIFGSSSEVRRETFRTRDGSEFISESSRGEIEYPASWTGGKSNLPLHGMQLLNVLMTRDFTQMNKGIDETLLRRGERNGMALLDGACESARQAVKATGNWKSAIEAIGRKSTMDFEGGGGFTSVNEDGSIRLNGRKALTTGGVGSGAEFVAVELSSVLQRRLYLESKLAAIFAAREIDQPVENYLIPVRLALPEFTMQAAEGNLTTGAATENTPGTGQPTLAAQKLMGECDYSYEADEASIIPMLPFIEEALSQGAAHAYERALISGHSVAVAVQHMDNDVTDTATPLRRAEKLWNGFRRLSLTVADLIVDGSGNKADFALWETMQAVMGIYGLDPDALIWVNGPKATRRMKSAPQVQTAYAYGESRATIITGRLERFDGIPVVNSMWMRETVASTGVNTAAGPNTFGSNLLIRPDRFLTGRRRAFTIEILRWPPTQTNRIVASFRRSFTPVETPSATVPSVIVSRNWI